VSVRSLEDLPDEPIVGVVLANELLDNLPFDLVERTEGGMLLIDYMATSAELATRGGWLRTYRDHRRGSDPFAAPGATDITADVRLEPLRAALDAAGLTDRREEAQADWLHALGLVDLVAEGEETWRAGAATGDLAALAGRSRGVEAANLTDPAGLGGFTVCTARRAPRPAGADG
jgi:SAM-dependent MidA family methyltransferase